MKEQFVIQRTSVELIEINAQIVKSVEHKSYFIGIAELDKFHYTTSKAGAKRFNAYDEALKKIEFFLNEQEDISTQIFSIETIYCKS